MAGDVIVGRALYPPHSAVPDGDGEAVEPAESQGAESVENKIRPQTQLQASELKGLWQPDQRGIKIKAGQCGIVGGTGGGECGHYSPV